jgi:hypothetical protein
LPDTTCRVFAVPVSLDAAAIHRFVVGEDDAPRQLSTAEAAHELGDPFAEFVLLRGSFPQTAEESVEALKAAVPEGDPLRNQMSFVLGEGSQIAFSDETKDVERSMRFLVTLGATSNGPPEGPDVLVSAFFPQQPGVELMAWDRRTGGFNYYRSMGRAGQPHAWVFAGNSRHALDDPTQGKGPFESHKSGALLMKELKTPWVNWHSSFARISATAFSPMDTRRDHTWFTKKEPGGAYAFEFEVARPAIARWAKARFDALRASPGAIENPGRIIEQVIDTPTVSLISSSRESLSAIAATNPLELPPTFFVDADGLALVGLEPPPTFEVGSGVYARALQTFDVRLADENGFSRPGDTHFAFVVPERAFEDVVVLGEALAFGLVTRRLAACLLMTDFPNPIFSERRAALLEHVPPSATVTNGESTFSQEFADAILIAARAAADGSPEKEFAERWNVGESFEGPFNELLQAYYAAVTARLDTQAGFDDFFRLAESRRAQVRPMPIFESPLLFASTNLASATLSMRQDASVGG